MFVISFFFFKQKTAYEMRISDWSSDVCSSDLTKVQVGVPVLFVNEELSPGLKRGGVLNVVRHELELVCEADKIPDDITIDVTEIGRASCRERVCQYVYISVVAVSLKKTQI